jgi:DNA-binding LacI/PurR family transcriptional regulator
MTVPSDPVSAPVRARAPSMADVADRAGVSHQTVSRVVNNHPSVLPETRARVRAAIADLGYRRNSAARALVTRRSGVLGVLTPAGTAYGPTSTFLALEDAAQEAGYVLAVGTLRLPHEDSAARALNRFLGLGVEGVAVIAPTEQVLRVVSEIDARVPVVMLSSATRLPDRPLVGGVSVAQREGAAAATAHLLAGGASEVLHVAGPQDWFDAQERVRGWRAACVSAGAPTPAPVETGWSAREGYALGVQLVREGLPPAVFAANDQLALGLLHALREHGVRVPDDVALVGFDDEPGAAHYAPPLTTVRQDFAGLGAAAMQYLAEALDGSPTPRRELTAELVVRASSARV